ncbi:hypothetical protein RF11_06102 [Thelohanellus kitauei]|uniref:Uncharacterized protein n=1 Tax=Thelohanellus kitauei TaxID=669202 RepID=A0A0C2MVA9_THEKT|nr:hypothetical protein RF11_06102 [Thelohanellus kitauei]
MRPYFTKNGKLIFLIIEIFQMSAYFPSRKCQFGNTAWWVKDLSDLLGHLSNCEGIVYLSLLVSEKDRRLWTTLQSWSKQTVFVIYTYKLLRKPLTPKLLNTRVNVKQFLRKNRYTR